MTDPISIRALQQIHDPEMSPRRQELKVPDSKDSFGDMLIRAVNSVDQTMKESDQNVQDFIAGKTDNVHDVMISMQRAQISFQLMVEIRNKAIETYHEISRMQI
jgi:flagellar hook-basal body complex protein FliE